MSLNRIIKNNLIETKSEKETLLIERKLVKARFMMILESEEKINNFHNLSDEEQTRIAFQIYEEYSTLYHQGLIKEEGLADALSSLFGKGLWSIPEVFGEKIVNSILSALGMKDSYFKKTLISFFTSNPSEIVNAFRDCRIMSKLVARSLAEAFVMQVQQQKEFGGTGWDILRNAIAKQFESSDFGKKIEEGISGVICGLFSKFTSKANGVLSNTKSADKV
jgi:hypothetical protein